MASTRGQGRSAGGAALHGLLASALLAGPPAAHAELGCSPETSAVLAPLVDRVAAMPEGGWLRVNENSISDAFTPRDLRPSSGALVSTPEKVIRAWSGFAWDCRRGDLLIFGGGHANYSGNDPYRWRSSTLRWERMSLPSDVVRIGDSASYTAIDGAFAAPVGAHTYDNNIYLPFVDRLLVVGGSAWNTGGPFVAQTGPDSARTTGPYLFDLARANPDRVGGTTGSHVKRVAPYPEVVGGLMWANRDLYEFMPAGALPANFTGGTTAYASSAGRDVLYLSARANSLSTQQSLYRYELSDADDGYSDVMSLVGTHGGGANGRGAGAYDPHRNVYVRTGKSSPRYDVLDGGFAYWNLATPGSANKSVLFVPTDLSGGWVLDRGYGMDYDPVRRQYLMWSGDREVWVLKAPGALSANGWTIERAPAGAGTAPVYPYLGYTQEPGGGVLGKWKYIPELDAFMGLEGPQSGNVWLYKPAGWVRPGSPLPPGVTFAAAPPEVTAGETTLLTWDATEATACTASGGWSGAKSTAGSQAVGPLTSTTRYTLACTGAGGTTTRTVEVRVVPALLFTATPEQVQPGTSATLSWSAPWASSCTASGGWSGSRATSGSALTPAITSDTTFSLTCSNAVETVTRSVTVGLVALPRITLTGDPTSLAAGMTSTLRWSVSGATSCEATRGWTGPRATSGSETVGPISVSTRYDLTCTGPGGTATAKLLLSRTW